MNPPRTILNVQTIAIILDYVIISILVKYKTNHETMIAFIDLVVENARTGKATPGSSQTVRKLTGVCGDGKLDEVVCWFIISLEPAFDYLI